MTTYERVTTRDEETGKHSTRILSIIAETPRLLHGWPVGKDGEDRSFYNEDGVLVEVQELIDKSLITKRVPMVMNKTYSELEVAK